MTELIRQAFERFGADVCVEHAGQSMCTRAFVQPLTAESNREPFSVAPLGAVDERCWRYLGLLCAEMGDVIVHDGVRYAVRRAAPVYAGGEVAYYWAVLHIEEETA